MSAENRIFNCNQCNLVYYSKGALTRHKNQEHDDAPLDLHQQFMQKYFDLDKSIRRQTILHFEGQPYTWNPIWVEVHNKTAVSYRMLEQLKAEGNL